MALPPALGLAEELTVYVFPVNTAVMRQVLDDLQGITRGLSVQLAPVSDRHQEVNE